MRNLFSLRLPSSFPPPLFSPHRLPLSSSLFSLSQFRPPTTSNHARKVNPLVFAPSASASFDELNANGKSHSSNASKKFILSNLIQEIEPLDVSLIQKDVPPNTVDAMKRTISGMLGLLPSDQFQVFIESFWEPLSKLLVSSMMTGYTLRNAEYRLCLEKNFQIDEGNFENQKPENTKPDAQGMSPDADQRTFDFSGENDLLGKAERYEDDLSYEGLGIQGIGEMTPEARQYILHLQTRFSSVKKELREIKRKNAALQMQQFVGEEKNDLLDYLRSLQPEKVAELSEPTSPELQETIHSVIHGLLATLSPKMHSNASFLQDNASVGISKDEDCTELLENTSIQFQPLISVTRDYLARLLFWCMLLGHYLRGLEYRLQLMELLTLSGDVESSQSTDAPSD
ncbi:uncharacterized protein LOC122073044 isoform X1 [Macadamia integrifolia]|uniref:uncharacterized protein LOC122073044 isoform X1 n=1 Tax=Macadamia integrifolia TaxID=60698 RepID=UPI001C4F9EB2|nr:uncharacterized protein LOC122073044 isoform X1 [Macadamia integrifolia]